MSVLKCKMCGGDLHIEEGMTVCECEYCGSKQTVPTIDNDKKISLYERANRLRYNCEFDKAETAYESIVADFHDEAEAYWGLVLCKYGIEYVDDPATGKKVPTCHRSSFDSVMDDTDFEMVMENSDDDSRQVYREQAKQIEEIRKGIIEVSGKEQPYDIFICYKETAKDGQRTIDSVLAQDVYDALTSKGYRVFFSRITLEDKLGQEYEPYIFAALNSAKVMLAFGTEYDYFNAVWVKNEWSRFLKLMASDKSKHLIPCYKNIDAYDIPKEFAKLQAQDMGKVGAIQDLLRGIDKLLGKGNSASPVIVEKVVSNIDVLLKKGYLALEDKDWDEAKRCFYDAININPELGEAYWGLTLEDQECISVEEFVQKRLARSENIAGETSNVPYINQNEIDELIRTRTIPNYLFKREIMDKIECECKVTLFKSERVVQLEAEKDYIQNDKFFRKALRFSEGDLQTQLENACKQILYAMEKRVSEAEEHDRQVKESVEGRQVESFNNAQADIDSLYNNALNRRNADYDEACEKLKNETNADSLLKLCDVFANFGEYKDSVSLSDECAEKAKRLVIQKRKKKKSILIGIAIGVAIIVVIIIILAASWRSIQKVYAKNLLKGDKYEKAYSILNTGNYDDADILIKNNELKRAQEFLEADEYEKGYEILETLGEYGDANILLQDNMLSRAEDLYSKALYDEALELLTDKILANLDKAKELKYQIIFDQACCLVSAGNYEQAVSMFEKIIVYDGAKEKKDEILGILADKCINAGDYKHAYEYLVRANDERRFEVAYKEAETLFESKDYENAYIYYNRVQNRIEDANDKALEAAYIIGTNYYNEEDYPKAVEWFTRCGYLYKDSEKKAYEARYQYSIKHKGKANKKTKVYLTLLKSKQYKDAEKIYKEIYGSE